MKEVFGFLQRNVMLFEEFLTSTGMAIRVISQRDMKDDKMEL